MKRTPKNRVQPNNLWTGLLAWSILSIPMVGMAQNFRNLQWTYTQSQVTATEQGFALGAELTNEETGGTDLLYLGEWMGLSTNLIYFFNGAGRLYRVAYGFVDVRADAAAYRADFDQVEAALQAQYGPPTSVTDTWNTAEGYLSHTWELADTIMIHALLKTDGGVGKSVGHALDLVRR